MASRTVSYNFDLSRQSPTLNRSWADMLHGQRRSMENMVRDSLARKDEIKRLESRNAELEGEIEALERQLQEGAGAGAAGAGPRPAQPQEPRPEPPALESSAWLGKAPPTPPVSPRKTATPPATPPAGGDLFKLEQAIRAHSHPVHGVAVGPESSVCATASWDATVKIVDIAGTGGVVRTLGDRPEGAMSGGLYSVAFSRTQRHILGCTSADTHVYIWDHTTGERQHRLEGHTEEVNGIDFHPGQNMCATASDDRCCKIWDLEEHTCLRTLPHGTRAVYGCKFMGLENEYLVSTCSFDYRVRTFDMRSQQVVGSLEVHPDDITGLDFSSRLNLLATGSDDGTISLVDVRMYKLMGRLDTKTAEPENEVKRVAFSPDGLWLAAACSSGSVLVYDVGAYPANHLAVLSKHTDCVFDVAWGVAPDGAKMLVSAAHDNACAVWKYKL